MAIKTYRALATYKGNLKVQASAREFSLLIDEPEENGGENQGMSPVELLLCSLGTCQTITTIIYADFYGIPIENLSVEIEGDMDSDGFSGADPSQRSGFQKIRSIFRMKSNAPKMQLMQLIKMVESKCPVGDSIGHGVELEPAELIQE